MVVVEIGLSQQKNHVRANNTGTRQLQHPKQSTDAPHVAASPRGAGECGGPSLLLGKPLASWVQKKVDCSPAAVPVRRDGK